jgi:peptidyl-prolyl cis-trans isomerase SurA
MLCLIGVQLPAAAQVRAVPVDRIVAVVNDEVITSTELRNRISQALQQMRSQNMALPAPAALERQTLERMIADRVQIQMARETGLKIEDAALDRALERIAENNRLTPAAFRAALEKDGIPWAVFREEVRSEMTIGRLREREVENRIAISEAEIDHFLEAQQKSAMGADEFDVAHILFRMPEKATPEQSQRLQARATKALTMINEGEEFAKVAALYSDAPDALNGGTMGWRKADRLPPIFVEALAKLEPGQVSAVLRSPAGLHIIKLRGKRGGNLADQKIQQTLARHILIKVTEVVSDTEARRRIESLRDRIKNGEDFAELARLHSNDLSAAKGGDLGWIFAGDTVPEFERVMDALKPSELSEPTRSPFGWHLIQVQERRVQDASSERQRLIARNALRERKSEEAYQEWLRQLRDRAYVEIRLQDR